MRPEYSWYQLRCAGVGLTWGLKRVTYFLFIYPVIRVTSCASCTSCDWCLWQEVRWFFKRYIAKEEYREYLAQHTGLSTIVDFVIDFSLCILFHLLYIWHCTVCFLVCNCSAWSVTIQTFKHNQWCIFLSFFYVSCFCHLDVLQKMLIECKCYIHNTTKHFKYLVRESWLP